MAFAAHSRSVAPTKEQIIGLVGEVDDATAMAIINTGSSSVEFEGTARWAAGETSTGIEPPPLSGPSRAVYELLLSLPSFDSSEDFRR